MKTYPNLTQQNTNDLLSIAKQLPPLLTFERQVVLYADLHSLPIHEVAHYAYCAYCVYLNQNNQPPQYTESYKEQ